MRKNYKKFLLKIGGSLVLTATLLFNSNNVFGQNTVALVHGADDASFSSLGVQGWISNGDLTFDTAVVNSTSGFDRDDNGTEVFGFDDSSQTFFADVNKDGLVDIIHATETGGNAIYVYLNNGDNTFATTAIASTGLAATGSDEGFAGLAGDQQGWIADTNNDGNLDYAFSGNDNDIHVYFGDGNGGFSTAKVTTAALTGSPGIRATSGIGGVEYFELIDLNKDGSADLVGATDDSTGLITIWLNTGDGSGTFNTVPTTVDIDNVTSSNAAGRQGREYSQFIDVNGDGNVDYAHSESYGVNGESIYIYLGNDTGSFFSTTFIRTDISSVPPAGEDVFANYTSSRQSFFLDLNDDGYVEYITTTDNDSGNNGFTVYQGNSNSIFTDTANNTNFSTFSTGNSSSETTYLIKGMLLSPSELVLAQIGREGDNPDTVNSVVTVAQLGQISPALTNVIAANETAYQDYIDNNPDDFSSPATQAEVQTMINAANASQAALVEVLEDSASPGGANNGNGTAVTATQLAAIDGVTGVVAANESAYQAAIAAEDGFTNPPTVAEVQAIIDSVNALSEVLEDSASTDGANNGNGTAVTATQLAAIDGVTGVVAANESAYQAAIAAEDGFTNPPTVAEVQAIIDSVNALAEVLEDSQSGGGANNGNGTAVTAAQLAAIDGITGVDPANEAAYQAAINAEMGFTNPPTVAEVQAIIDEVNTNVALTEVLEDSASPDGANNVNGTAVTAAQLASIDGITGVDPANEAAYQAAIAAEDGFDNPPTVAQVQAIINSVNLLVSIGEDADDGVGSSNDLTAAQYNSIEGVSGALAANEAAYQIYINFNPASFSQPATAQEVQDMIDAVNSRAALIEVLEDSATPGTGGNNANGTAVTADQLASIDGITGVNPANEAAYQTAIAAEDGFDNPPTVAQVQAIIDSVNSLAEVLEDSASTGGDNNGNGTAVTATQLAAIDGVTGVDPANEAAYQAAIAAETGFSNPPTAAEVQAIIDSVNALAEVLEDSVSTGGDNNSNGTAVTLAQLQAIDGIMNVVPANLARYQSAIAAETGFSNPPTLAQVQAIIDAENASALADEDFELSKKFSVYPNPTADILYLQKEVENVKVFDILGKKLIDVDNTKEINLTSYRTGVYYVMIKTEVSSFTKKVIKK